MKNLILPLSGVVLGLMLLLGFRLALNFRRLVEKLKAMSPEVIATLPAKVQAGITGKWVTSWQSDLFYDIGLSDIGWAEPLPLKGAVKTFRRDFHWFLAAVGAAHVVFIGAFLALR